MEYKKRKYDDVKGTFDYTLTTKTLFKTYEVYGVNKLGLWLWMTYNTPPLGFFEWAWIKEILISQKDEAIYIVMYDMDKIVEEVILCNQWLFKKMCVCTQANGEKAIGLAQNIDTNRVIQYIIDADLAKVVSIE